MAKQTLDCWATEVVHQARMSKHFTQWKLQTFWKIFQPGSKGWTYWLTNMLSSLSPGCCLVLLLLLLYYVCKCPLTKLFKVIHVFCFHTQETWVWMCLLVASTADFNQLGTMEPFWLLWNIWAPPIRESGTLLKYGLLCNTTNTKEKHCTTYCTISCACTFCVWCIDWWPDLFVF